MHIHRLLICIATVHLLLSTAHPQGQIVDDSRNLYLKETTIQGNGSRGPYPLPDYFILSETEIVSLAGRSMMRHLDYSMDYDAGEITFQNPVPEGTSIHISYHRLPIGLKRSYSHRRLVRSTTQDEIKIEPGEISSGRALDLPDMSQLRIGGSKSLGISLGSDRDLSLEQALRLNITGTIAKDIEVVALLSDQSSPLQPEGTTQTLEELDKVAIELRGKHVQATFGDYTLSLQNTEFGRFNRKLQGAMGQLTYPTGHLNISGASSKGIFTTNRFMGIEGNQGPYQLKNDNGSVNIIILGGTERVWIDGEPMRRGEHNDYTIEYANGQITFTRHRLITAESRIVVDFEYIDEDYRRSLYAGNGSLSLGGEKVQADVTFFRESDDRDDPLSVMLSDADRNILAAAGDDTDAATNDSTNTRLPLPHSHNLADVHLRLATGVLDLSGEFGVSQYDKNTFSVLDDDDNVGQAVQFKGLLNPPSIALGNRNMGRIELAGFYRHIGKDFQEIGRRVQAEYDRRWDLPSTLISASEEVGELSAVYRPHQASIFGFGTGRIERGREFEATRDEFRTDLTLQAFPEIHYLLERIESHDRTEPDSISTIERNWIRHTLQSGYTLWKLKPIVKLEGERKEERYSGQLTDGFKFYEIDGGLSTHGFKTCSFFTGFMYRKDWDFEERWLDKSESKTIRGGLTFKEWKSLSASAEYTNRSKHFLDMSGTDRTTDLADFKMNYAPLNRAVSSNLRYQVSSMQAARKDRQFIDVGEWKGNYRFDEQTKEYIYDPGKQESRYLLRTQTVGDFEPVIELKTNLNVRIRPSNLFEKRREPPSRLTRWLSMVESETVLKIDETTKEQDTWAIYLLDLSKFQQDSTTVEGRMTLRQDLFILPQNQKLNVRLRYEQSDDESNQFIDQETSEHIGEERLRVEESVRLRSKISGRFDLQGELKMRQNRRQAGEQITYNIHSNIFSADIGYRPRSPIEVSLKSAYSRDEDRNSEQRSLSFSLSPGLSYSLPGKGRARAEASWTHVSVDRTDLLLFYTMAGGKKQGNNFDWSFNLDYRLHRYVTILISYTGRSEPDRPVIHTGRAEMRAFF